MHLRTHLTPSTKTRFAIGAAVLILVILASTSSRWLLPFVEFAGSHSTHIEAIAALVQIVLWGGAGVLALVQVWGLRRRPGPASDVIVLHPGSERMSPDALWRVIGERRPAQDLTRVTERYLEHLVDRLPALPRVDHLAREPGLGRPSPRPSPAPREREPPPNAEPASVV